MSWRLLPAVIASLLLLACSVVDARPLPPTADVGVDSVGAPAIVIMVPVQPPAPAVAVVAPPDRAAPPAQPALLPVQRALTSGGCCVQPEFSPDGSQVRYIDRPEPSGPAGIWAVDVSTSDRPALVSPTVGFRSPDQSIVAVMEGRSARFWNEGSGQSWLVNTSGGFPSIGPGNQRIVWTASDQVGNFDQRRTDFWTAALDGSNPRRFASLLSGSLLDWFPDGQQVLLSGRDAGTGQERTVMIVDLASGSRRDLLTQKGIRGASLSHDGRWLAFYASFTDDPAQAGFQIVDVASGRRVRPELPAIGAFRWGAGGTLLVVPARDPGETSMRLVAVDAASGTVRTLTDPAITSFSIANNDWDVSPDGRNVVYVASADRNLYLLTLP